MARIFTRWRVSVAACVMGSSIATAHAQQPTLLAGPLTELGSVLAEAPIDVAEPAAAAALEEATEEATATEPDDSSLDFETPEVQAPEVASEVQVPEINKELPAEGVGQADPEATVELIKERYPNGDIKIEREVTQDSFGNYIHHGKWKMFDQQGNTIAQGQFVNNLRDGIWHRWHHRNESKLLSALPYSQFQEPFISEAHFKDGQISGKWIIYDAKQRKVSEWEFADGQRHGVSTWYLANGRKLREMTYRDGAIHGELVEWNVNGEPVLRETYQDGRKLAPKVANYKNNPRAKQSEGMYLFAKIVPKTADDWWNCIPADFTQVGKDERHGVWTSWYPNGQKQMVGEYRNDIEVGRFTWWYDNGQKATEGEFKIGKPHGEWVWWHPNGQKATQGLYSLGNPTGRWSGWDESGRLTRAEDHSEPHNAAGVGEIDTDRSAELPQLQLTQPRPIFK